MEPSRSISPPFTADSTSYNKKNREMQKREKELDEITEQRDSKRKEYDELRKKRLNMFMSGFNEITLKLKEMYDSRCCYYGF